MEIGFGKITCWKWQDESKALPIAYVSLKKEVFNDLSKVSLKFKNNFLEPMVLEGDNLYTKNGYFATNLRSVLKFENSVALLIKRLEYVVANEIFQDGDEEQDLYSVILYICEEGNKNEVFGENPEVNL